MGIIGGPLDPGTLVQRAVTAGQRAVEMYGEDQVWKLVEDLGNTLVAVARHKRGLGSTADVVGVCADLLISVVGTGCAAYGNPWERMRAALGPR